MCKFPIPASHDRERHRDVAVAEKLGHGNGHGDVHEEISYFDLRNLH